MSFFNPRKTSFLSFLVFFTLLSPTIARKRHIITVKSPNLYPENFAWDPSAQHFLLSSFRHGTVHSVSDAGVTETLISDPDLPNNISILGIAVDSPRGRLLAVIHNFFSPTPFDALAAYDLKSRKRIYLSPLSDPSDSVSRLVANDVAVDFFGNGYVTSSAGNFIWKVDASGHSSIFSRSPVFSSQRVYEGLPASWCGLNGIVHRRTGYLLTVQTNTGKLYKVDDDDGRARVVSVDKDLIGADGIAMRSDGVAVIVSSKVAWLLRSVDGWDEAKVIDEIALKEEKFPTGVAVREDDTAYVLYGHLNEVMGNVDREEFSIEELESEKERDSVLMLVLIGFGVVYFLYWKYMMWRLAKNMNKKRD